MVCDSIPSLGVLKGLVLSCTEIGECHGLIMVKKEEERNYHYFKFKKNRAIKKNKRITLERC